MAVSGRLAAQAPCPVLPLPTGPVIEVQPSQVSDLPEIVANAATGTTILFHNGTYDLDGAFLHITTGPIRDRGGTAVLTTNLSDEPASLFADVAAGDLHLVSAGSSPVDAGTSLPAGACDGDIDRQPRDTKPDIGADEFGWGIFVDGFESGKTSFWSTVTGGP